MTTNATVIGPSFADELRAAGLLGLPFSWGTDGTFEFSETMTSEQRAAVLAVREAHDPVKSVLRAYANARQWGLALSGFTVTIDGAPRTFATDTSSQSLISGKMLRLSQPSPPDTVDWQFGDTFVTITKEDFTDAAVKIADFVQATFDRLKHVLDGINRETITTREQIDAAAWPAAHD